MRQRRLEKLFKCKTKNEIHAEKIHEINFSPFIIQKLIYGD